MSTECYISKAHNLMGDMLALTAIENIGKYLVRAVRDGSDLEAREGVAFANNLSGQVMTVSACTSEHSMEHAMSAYHQELPHGAGLIMISVAYYQHFIDCHVCDERFVAMAKALGKADASTFWMCWYGFRRTAAWQTLKCPTLAFRKASWMSWLGTPVRRWRAVWGRSLRT